MSSLRDKILEAEDLKREEVFVPEWGVTVYIRGMSGAERDAYEHSIIENNKAGKLDYRGNLIVRVAVDEQGHRIFSDSDSELVGEKSAGALQRLFNVATRLNKMSDSDIGELAKNSERGRPDDSHSGSASPSDDSTPTNS